MGDESEKHKRELEKSMFVWVAKNEEYTWFYLKIIHIINITWVEYGP